RVVGQVEAEGLEVEAEALLLVPHEHADRMHAQVRLARARLLAARLRRRPARPGDGDERAHAGAGASWTARRSAARASRRVESSVGSGEFASFMIKGISVQPSTTASQPSPCSRAITFWK